jgi:uncharacterized membrane protein
MILADLLRLIAQTIATFVEGVGVAIVAVAVFVATARYLVALVGRARPFPPETLRLGLGRSLALSLEFLLGADILRTAVEPSWNEIGRLAAIAAIRTALNYFLQREIAGAAVMAAANAGGGAPDGLSRPAEPVESGVTSSGGTLGARSPTLGRTGNRGNPPPPAPGAPSPDAVVAAGGRCGGTEDVP